MARCKTLAEGLWSAHGRGLADDGARMAEVAAHFGRAGIDLEHPYLNPGSPHRYEVPGHDA
jgi:hypothetical protein